MLVNFRLQISAHHHQLIILPEIYVSQPDYLGLRGVAETCRHLNQKEPQEILGLGLTKLTRAQLLGSFLRSVGVFDTTRTGTFQYFRHQ